jgi:hypothetical protein
MPYSYRAEKRGFVITSRDGKKFSVTDPDGRQICDDLGTAYEAMRVCDAAINRLPPEGAGVPLKP